MQSSSILKTEQKHTLLSFFDDDGSNYKMLFSITDMQETLKYCSTFITAAGEYKILYSIILNLPDVTLYFLSLK